MKSPRDDLHLLRRVARQDRGAFETLYHRYYRRLFSFVFRVTRRAEIVDEVVNDVMLALWQSADRFAERSKPSTWIFGIAYRKALKALRRLSRSESENEETLTGTEPSFEGDGPISVMIQRELAGALGKALAALSPEQRSVVELTYFQELSYREIAEIVGCPVNTVKTRMFHARRRLRQLLPAMGWEQPVEGGNPQ